MKVYEQLSRMRLVCAAWLVLQPCCDMMGGCLILNGRKNWMEGLNDRIVLVLWLKRMAFGEILPRKLTQNLKIALLKRNIIFQTSIFLGSMIVFGGVPSQGTSPYPIFGKRKIIDSNHALDWIYVPSRVLNKPCGKCVFLCFFL